MEITFVRGLEGWHLAVHSGLSIANHHVIRNVLCTALYDRPTWVRPGSTGEFSCVLMGGGWEETS